MCSLVFKAQEEYLSFFLPHESSPQHPDYSPLYLGQARSFALCNQKYFFYLFIVYNNKTEGTYFSIFFLPNK